MKNSLLFKCLFLGILLTSIFNGCSVNDRMKFGIWENENGSSNNKIIFIKSSNLNWKNKIVQVSFEDEFQNFSPINMKTSDANYTEFRLSKNNLEQGVAIRLKVIDFFKKSEKVNEIMIESYDLSKGLNQFTIGYKDNTPFIIY